MASADADPTKTILPERNPRALGENPAVVQAPTGRFGAIELGSGAIVVDENTPQVLYNKSLDADTTTIANTADPTKKVKVDTTGAASTTATMIFTQTVDRTYTVPDSGANASFVMTEGAQTVNGQKTFNAPLNLSGREYSSGAVSGTTVGNVTTALASIAVPNNTVMLLEANCVAATAAGQIYAAKVFGCTKNVGGTLTTTSFDRSDVREIATDGALLEIVGAGTTVSVQGRGSTGVTLNWAGKVSVTYLAF